MPACTEGAPERDECECDECVRPEGASSGSAWSVGPERDHRLQLAPVGHAVRLSESTAGQWDDKGRADITRPLKSPQIPNNW